jgi:hypothetical protein
MTRTLAIGCLMILALAAPCRADDKPDIAGSYAGKGANPDGKEYEAKVEVTKNGDTYKIKWEIAGSGEEYEGFGILEGDIFSVSYKAGDGHGVVSYKVTKGKLDGKWSPGDGKIYTETLTKK